MVAQRNIGSEILAKFGAAKYYVATGSGLAAVTGEVIDTQGYRSCTVAVTWNTTLASGKTFKLAVEYQQGSTTACNDTATALQASTEMAAYGGTLTGCTSFDLDLSDKKRYVRVNFTPALDAANTDICVTAVTVILGGAVTKPC